MSSRIQPYQYVALRLPSDSVKVEQLIPNSLISFGKYGSFNVNDILGRPFHLTFEILDRSEQKDGQRLRVVKAAELHAETCLEEAEPDLNDEGSTSTPDGASFDENGLLVSNEKSNVNIIDDPSIQKLTMADIEALKSDEMANPRDLIARIMASHSQLDQKTAFSLAKYTLRKQKKYMKRFTVFPLDVATLVDYMMLERDFNKVMEIRNETFALMGSWSNVHVSTDEAPGSRYLVVDDTGGLVVAFLAEKLGILYPDHPSSAASNQGAGEETEDAVDAMSRGSRTRYTHSLASSNTLTLVHSNQQANLSMLRFFNYDPNVPVPPTEPSPHPLHTHLKCLSWLQLLDPSADGSYQEPSSKSPEELQAMKTNARSTYHRKRRRWERCKAVVDETRTGGFDGLIIASYTNPTSIVRSLVPLLAGGAQVVVYYPHIEPLLTLSDAFSTARRTAFLKLSSDERAASIPSEDFPLDPTTTLGFSLQSAQVRKWQVLPGRTHPLMMGRGGAPGYIATATRVLPVQGPVQARGKQRGKKRKDDMTGSAETPDTIMEDDEELRTEENGKRLKSETENGL